MKDVPTLQKDFFSEPVNGTYFTIAITSVDHDGGKIIGRRGEGKFLGNYLDGWLHWNGESSEIYLDFVTQYCELKADDKNFDRLYGKLVYKRSNESYDIVFNKAKELVVSG